jgi:hypothetical protein
MNCFTFSKFVIDRDSLHSYFSFQIGGNPRSFRETLIGEMFDGDFDKDMAMSADPKYIELQEKLSHVMVHGSMQDEMRMIFTD